MGVVALQAEILVAERGEVLHLGVEPHARKRPRRAPELLARLLEVVQIEVRIAQRQDELAALEAGDLGDHQREQGVGGDVERHAEKKIRAALVHLAGQPAFGDIELEQRVAGRQRHALDVGRIPRAHDVAPRFRFFSQAFDDPGDLVDLPALRRSPMAPLVAVHRAELAVLVGPLVPDRHAALLQPAHVGVAAQEPQQLVDDRLQVQLLGGEQREAVLEREAHLAAEHRERAGPGAVRLAGAALEQLLQQVEILLLAGVHIAMLVKSSRALWNRSSGFFASRRSRIGW